MTPLLRSFDGAVLALVCLTLCIAGCTAPEMHPPQPRSVRLPHTWLLCGGDVMFSRAVRREMLAHSDTAYPFRPLSSFLASADITFVNLESPFSDRGPYFSGGLIFHAAPDAIAGLELAGVDVVSTANNHARDCGPHGVAFTVNWLRAHGMAPVGSSDSATDTHAGVVIVRNGIRFGFLGYTFDQQNGNWRDIDNRIALTDVASLQRDVKNFARRVDVVLVSMHNGVEYISKPTRTQVQFAHTAIEAGASVVIGHHPHVVQAVERYGRGVIFYSVGNLVFDQYQREATQHGEIAELHFVGHRLLTAQAIPVHVTPAGPVWE